MNPPLYPGDPAATAAALKRMAAVRGRVRGFFAADAVTPPGVAEVVGQAAPRTLAVVRTGRRKSNG
jgi:hypothetical protein